MSRRSYKELLLLRNLTYDDVHRAMEYLNEGVILNYQVPSDYHATSLLRIGNTVHVCDINGRAAIRWNSFNTILDGINDQGLDVKIRPVDQTLLRKTYSTFEGRSQPCKYYAKYALDKLKSK